MVLFKKISLVLMIVLYTCAGINHFVHPETYYAIIPPYLPEHAFINVVSGVLEIVLGLLLIFTKTRTVATYGIMALLCLFIPAHIYMIQKGGCMSERMCIPAWAAWLRLIPLQFILIWWAWCQRNDKKSYPES